MIGLGGMFGLFGTEFLPPGGGLVGRWWALIARSWRLPSRTWASLLLAVLLLQRAGGSDVPRLLAVVADPVGGCRYHQRALHDLIGVIGDAEVRQVECAGRMHGSQPGQLRVS